MKLQRVRTFRDLHPQGFIAALLGKIFVQSQPQLAHMDPDRAIFCRTVAGRLAKDGNPDLALGQCVGLVLDRMFGEIGEESVQVGGLLERDAQKDALDEAPAGVSMKI